VLQKTDDCYNWCQKLNGRWIPLCRQFWNSEIRQALEKPNFWLTKTNCKKDFGDHKELKKVIRASQEEVKKDKGHNHLPTPAASLPKRTEK
jgi:hypothetical protein